MFLSLANLNLKPDKMISSSVDYSVAGGGFHDPAASCSWIVMDYQLIDFPRTRNNEALEKKNVLNIQKFLFLPIFALMGWRFQCSVKAEPEF